MTIVFCLEKGSPLTRHEADNNIRELLERIEKLEAELMLKPNPNPISEAPTKALASVALHETALHFCDTEGKELAPITLPTLGWAPKGAWACAESYRKGDVVFLEGSLYLCSKSHVSSESFDPNAWILVFQCA